MKKLTTYIDAGTVDTSRPKDRPPKTNWKVELLKKGLFSLQHIAPRKTSEIIWHHFTKPGSARFTPPQLALMEQAQITYTTYRGHQIVHYRWGTEGPKVLLSHGWRSKVLDFRRMIEALVASGFVVEGIDMKAHGQSEGKHTGLPEFRDILKGHYVKSGPFHAVIGYSLGGLAAGLALSEVAEILHPKHLVLMATPPFARYFFYETVRDLGYREAVYEEMCQMVERNYFEPVDYFDLRNKMGSFPASQVHLIYDEHDSTVTLERGQELHQALPTAHFLHTKGLGHYQIIAHEEVIDQVIQRVSF